MSMCYCDNQYEAYFGDGTKLTVLETGHEKTPPTVKIFKPSKNERPREKGDSKYKTLVCMASGFYPDHVKVSWTVDGEPRKRGASTDSVAQRIGKSYTISSRLLLPQEDWSKCSECIVTFYDGKANTNYTKALCGIEGGMADDRGGMSREKYLRITQNAKLSYAIFIVKGAVYGLFVAFLICKIQRANGKHSGV